MLGLPGYLLPLNEVTNRVRPTRRTYLGVRSIPVDRIIGSVDRACEFDRRFRPRRRVLRARLDGLRTAFPAEDGPAISVLEVGGAYFVSDGHHRVALARERGQDYLDAEVVRFETTQPLSPEVDVSALVEEELRRGSPRPGRALALVRSALGYLAG